MKIAVAKDGTNVSGHFGHCEGFQVFEVVDGKIQNDEFLVNPGHKPGFLPKFLSEQGTSVIIVGGMGASAQTLFRQNDIDVIVGVTGSVAGAINAYNEGRLVSTNSVCKEHAHHDSCGNH